MLRTHTCGELNLSNLGDTVTLCGWVQKSRDLGGTTFIDVRDRYGLTQLVFNEDTNAGLREKSRSLGREFVIMVTGKVIERTSKNLKMPTGEIEIQVTNIEILNPAKLPPFMIEDETDGGEELRARYRYLDLRRNPIRNNLMMRHRMSQEIRKYLDALNFIEVETPVLIKSTPEGARDFVVPSRMNPGEFYALPQSPQTFKQLLMVSGFDRYFQIVKCFRDEDLRADRQPEFTQIDCELSFITQEDILNIFEGLTRHLFKTVKDIDLKTFPRMQYADAMRLYGSDKPDIRFGMPFVELKNINLLENDQPTLWKSKVDINQQGFADIAAFTQTAMGGFPVFNAAELVAGINAKECAGYTRKQLDELTDYIKRPQIGAAGLIYLRYNLDGSLKSSVDKFFIEDDLKRWATVFEAEPGDLILIIAGKTDKTRKQLNELRLKLKFCNLLQSNNCINSVFKKHNTFLPKLKMDDFDGSYCAFAFHLSYQEFISHYNYKNNDRPDVNRNSDFNKDDFFEICNWIQGEINVSFSAFNNSGSGSPWEFNKDNLVPTELWEIANHIGCEQNGIVFFVRGHISELLNPIKQLKDFFIGNYSISIQLDNFYSKYLSKIKDFAPLWVLDFPLLEWDEENGRYHAMHHPFTSPKPEDIAMLDTAPGDVRANAYDLVINGVEIGGGSIRIHNRDLQSLMFKHLGFSPEEAQKQFGFLMDAFEYGAPPHGGLAFGFDRLCSIFAGLDSIRDVIAFPKNNSGRDVMIDTPSTIADAQLKELKINVNPI